MDPETLDELEALLRLRRVERVCLALEVEQDVAALIIDLTDRVAELEEQLRRAPKIILE